ncbi:MAG: BamA/TamA family outer membrane protein, partial [bacterium]|nr:BamA/TamA family outer membrane protein [bacterium]
VHAALGGPDGMVNAGYTHYDLLNRGGVLNLTYGFSSCGGSEDVSASDPGDDGCTTEFVGLGLDPTFSTWSSTGFNHQLRLTLGLPIQGNHSLRLLTSYRYDDVSLRREALETDPDRYGRADHRNDFAVNLSWVFNSVDDPVFPTTGVLLEAGVDLKYLSADMTQCDFTDEITCVDSDAKSYQLAGLATGKRYTPVGEKGSVWFGGELLLGGSRVRSLPLPDLSLASYDTFVWSGAVTVGYGSFLKRNRSNGRWRDLRWDSSLRLAANGIADSPWDGRVPGFGLRISTGLTYRNTWGVLRAQLSYVAVEAR